MIRRPHLSIPFIAILALAVPVAGQGQVAAPATPAPPAITKPEIQNALAKLSADESPDDGNRAQAIKLYEEALTEFQRAEDATSRQATLRSQAAEAPQLLAAIRSELEKPPVAPDVSVSPDATLQTLEQQLAQAEAELAGARTGAEELQRESVRRSDRRNSIPDELSKARTELAEIEASLRSKAAGADTEPLDAVRTALLRTRRLAVNARIAVLEAEIASYDARRDLLPARRDQAARRVSDAEKLVTAWQGLTNQRRSAKAIEDARQAAIQRQEAAKQHPVLQSFAAESEQLISLRTGPEGLTSRIRNTAEASSATRARVADLRRDFKSIYRRIDASGLNRATGLLLRRQYEALPVAARLAGEIRAINHDLEDADYDLIDYEERRLGAGDIDRVAQSLISEIETEGQPESAAEIRAAARDLAVARRDLLDVLVADAEAYRDRLVEADLAVRELLAVTEASEAFIGERILWVRSFAIDRLPRASEFRTSMSWLLDPPAWAKAGKLSINYLRARWMFGILGGALLLLTMGAGRWARSRIKDLAGLVAKYRTDSFGHTLEALALAFVAAIPTPLILWCIAWLLTNVQGQPEVAIAVGGGLKSAATFLLAFSFVRNIFGVKSVASAHFRWPVEAVRPLRRYIQWFIPIATPLVAITVALDAHGDEAANASLGRVVFSILLVAFALFFYRVLRPSGPVMREYLRRRAGEWVDRLRHVGFGVVFGLPIVLILATWTGYYYTAQRVLESFQSTILLVFGLIVLNGMLMRWLFLARRQVAIEDAKRRRDEAAKALAEDPPDELPAEATAPLDVTKLDLPAISGQTRELFRTAIFLTAFVGLFAIWAETLPALKMLDNIQIWPRVTMLETDETDSLLTLEAVTGTTNASPVAPSTTSEAAGAPTNGTTNGTRTPAALVSGQPDAGAPLPDDQWSVTLADIGIALLLLIFTWVAFRNLPGLVDIAVLQRLPLDAGSRYALSTVLRYAIAIIGIGATFGALGISWSRVQWLAAALTFGLAFGLQEIFANFVSGLIILAERPFRIGDTVTIGAVSGTVSRIRMRATTITDFDRKELVIPNKTFITGEVINWSLSDAVLRVKIPVGVAYGSDIDKAESILLEIAGREDTVLDEPKPQALFLGFGDSSLNFELRVFIRGIEHYVAVQHLLHRAIDKAFRAAKIEIAFPQRDLHVRSVGDLGKLLERRDDLTAGETSAWVAPE